MDLVQSFLWISSLARIWTWKAPRSPKRGLCSLHFKQRNNKNPYLYILILYYYILYTVYSISVSSASVMKMTGHLDDGFYDALAHQQSRQFKTCQGRKLRNQNRSSSIHSHTLLLSLFYHPSIWMTCPSMSHLLRQAIVILLHPVMQQPASPQLHKKPDHGGCWVKSTWAEARLVLCRTESSVSENRATKAFLMRRPTGKSNEVFSRSSSATISSIRAINYESAFCLTPLHTFAYICTYLHSVERRMHCSPLL